MLSELLAKQQVEPYMCYLDLDTRAGRASHRAADVRKGNVDALQPSPGTR
jgi:hypothetical protein